MERTQQEEEDERQGKFNETEKENECKKTAAEAKIKGKIEVIHTDSGNAEKVSLEKIVALKINLDDVVADDLNEDGVEYHEVKIAVETTIHDVKFVAEAVKGDDDEQDLYTLDSAKTEAIKLPTFEGLVDEDFAMFQDDVEKALPPEGAQEDELVSIRAKGTTELNLQEVSFDPQHSSKNWRGRLVTRFEVISNSSVEISKRFVHKMFTGTMMFSKASVFDLPRKFTSRKSGMKRFRNIQARKRKLKIFKDYLKLKMFKDYLPDVKEEKELFDDKKPPDDESDGKVVDVHRHRLAYMELGLNKESSCERNAETLFRDDQEVFQFNKPDQIRKIAEENEWFLETEAITRIFLILEMGVMKSMLSSLIQRGDNLQWKLHLPIVL